MKGKFRVWHRPQKRMFTVVLALIGLGTKEAQVQTSETTLRLLDCDLMISLEQLDVKKNEIFQDDVVHYPLKEGKKEKLVEGRVAFKNGNFVIEYEEEDEEGTIERKEIKNPDWNFCKVIGTIYVPPKKSWEK